MQGLFRKDKAVGKGRSRLKKRVVVRLFDQIKEKVCCNKKIAMLFAGLFLTPLLLSFFIYRCSIFSFIPGEEAVWLGFWASYSGTLATVVVAIFSFQSSRKLDTVEAALKDRENEYISVLIGVNIRLVKVHIIPLEAKFFKEMREDEFWKLNSIIEDDDYRKVSRFRLQFIFQNISYSMVEFMEVERISIGGKAFLVKGCSRFFLKGDLPVLEIVMPFLKGAAEEKDFSQFYFYYGQFKRNMKFLNIELDAKITMATYFEPINEGIGDVKKKPEGKNIKIAMQLEIEPQKDEEVTANKISIERYKINVG